MVILTTRQKKMVAIGQAQGKITLYDLRTLYSSSHAAKNALQRLTELHIFKANEDGIFIYLKNNEGTILNYLAGEVQ